MARALNISTPDIGTPDANRPEGYYLDEAAGIPGTPILADNKNDIYSFFSKLMEAASLTFNNTVDNTSASQFFSALQKVVDGAKQIVSTGGAVTLGDTNHIIEFDTSGGNLSCSLPAPDFIGQELNVYVDGSGILELSGTGLYTNNIFVTENTGLHKIKAVSATEWQIENEVTADYVSGNFHIQKKSDGKLIETYHDTFSSTALSGGGTSGIWSSQTYPISFISVEKNYGSLICTTARYIASSCTPGNKLTETGDVNVINATSTSTTGSGEYYLTREGLY